MTVLSKTRNMEELWSIKVKATGSGVRLGHSPGAANKLCRLNSPKTAFLHP